MSEAVTLAPEAAISVSTMEALVVQGDLSRLSSEQRLEVYMARCDAAGLDPRTQPFQYLLLKGKLTLYATKTATDQLIRIHGLSVQVVSRQLDRDAGIYEAIVRVTRPDQSYVEDMAALSIAGLRGEDLANAYMKTVTKAKRRTVLSACGLGMLDETETETIPGAQRMTIDAEIVPTVARMTKAQGEAIKSHRLRLGWEPADLTPFMAAHELGTDPRLLTLEQADQLTILLSDIPTPAAEAAA